MVSPAAVKKLTEFKIQLDKAWQDFKLQPDLTQLNNLNFITQVFAAKVIYCAEEEMINENKEASKTP